MSDIPLPTPERTTQTLASQTTTATTTKPPTTTSIPSTTQKITTTKKFDSVLGKPKNVKCHTKSETEIVLTWNPPDNGKGKIQEYKIFFSYNSQSGNDNY